MAQIAMNISRLSLPRKLIRGQEIISLSTDNPAVPGNTALVTALTTAQTALTAANLAFEEHDQAGKGLGAARDTALATWEAAVNNLAAFTESATSGDADKILTTGFDVRSTPAPPQPVAQIENVKVSFNGTPGYSNVRWKRDSNADAYVVQCSPDPMTETSWKDMGTVTEAKYHGNGATPGQKCWYRVAGVNRLGQGPWSEPALRPVMQDRKLIVES